MLLNRKLAIFIGFVLYAKSFGQFTNERPCFLQPLEIIANKTLYFAINFKGSFYEAHNFCRTHCMHLVSIESEAEQKGIANFLKNSAYKDEPIWTSGNDFAKKGEFQWLSTGQRMRYTNWNPGEPNNIIVDGVAEDCVHLYTNYGWNDYQCANKFFFICEIRQ